MKRTLIAFAAVLQQVVPGAHDTRLFSAHMILTGGHRVVVSWSQARAAPSFLFDLLL